MELHIEWQNKLGEGGEGAVYLGLLDGRTRCAVKVPHGHEQARRIPALRLPLVAALRRERDRVQQARGSHLIQLLGWNLDDEIPFLVYELAVGGSLEDVLVGLRKKTHRLSASVALEYIEQVLVALVELHESGLIHRDIKPHNLLRVEDGSLKLADLGLGRSLDRPCAAQTVGFAGTPLYAAPEQIAAECFSHAADLFGVGGVLWALLTNYPPPRARPLPRLSTIRNDTGPFLQSLVDRLLDVNPANRPATAKVALAEVRLLRPNYDAPQLVVCSNCGKLCRPIPCQRCGKMHCQD